MTTSALEGPDPATLFAVEGKCVLVTGSTAGIGRMIAEGFVRAGATVYVNGRRTDRCNRTAEELGAWGTCHPLSADLASEEGCRQLADALAQHTERLDVLVNNAGTIRMAPLDRHDDELWTKMLDLNLKAAFHLTRFVLPLLHRAAREGNPARVVNVGSMDAVRVPAMDSYAYSASKAALHHLTRHLAWRLAPSVTVNAIAPGTFPSRMSEPFLRSRDAEVCAAVPLRRVGRPADAAGSAIFLSSIAGAYVTGAVLPLDGGQASVGAAGAPWDGGSDAAGLSSAPSARDEE
jgi:NAD(P)-dependent dehydrogenase (short-subunit alcohol dehydrogenase family)